MFDISSLSRFEMKAELKGLPYSLACDKAPDLDIYADVAGTITCLSLGEEA